VAAKNLYGGKKQGTEGIEIKKPKASREWGTEGGSHSRSLGEHRKFPQRGSRRRHFWCISSL